ncbi:MAG TPA: DUF1707 domain-containing protein [Trebonia sp.]|jgi:hypothetical protein|nr:DUF1707 domain-containing protein [Trebonia sp.]
MPGDPRLRASDADRERAATLLREHHAVGRLTAEEFHERLEAAYAAKTQGELDALLADLPAIDLYRLPAAGIAPAPRGAKRRSHRHGGGPLSPGGLNAWIAWAAISALLFVAWIAVAALDGGAAWLPWFLVVCVPWAVALSRRRPR